MRSGAGDVLDHGGEAREFCGFECGGATALDDDREREAGLLGSFFEADAPRDAVIGDDELAALQSIDEVALRGCDLGGDGDQVGLGGEVVGILLLRLRCKGREGEGGKSQRTEKAESPHAGQYSCVATRTCSAEEMSIGTIRHRHGCAVYPEEACVVSSFWFWVFCVGAWAVGGFPSLSGLCAARSTDEGVVDELAEYGVESLGGRA